MLSAVVVVTLVIGLIICVVLRKPHEEPIELKVFPVEEAPPLEVIVDSPPVQSEMKKLMSGRDVMVRVPHERLAEIPVHRVIKAKVHKVLKKKKK